MSLSTLGDEILRVNYWGRIIGDYSGGEALFKARLLERAGSCLLQIDLSFIGDNGKESIIRLLGTEHRSSHSSVGDGVTEVLIVIGRLAFMLTLWLELTRIKGELR